MTEPFAILFALFFATYVLSAIVVLCAGVISMIRDGVASVNPMELVAAAFVPLLNFVHMIQLIVTLCVWAFGARK